MGSLFDEPKFAYGTAQKGFMFDNFKGPQVSVDRIDKGYKMHLVKL